METCHKRQSNRVSAMDNARASTITFKCHAGNEFIESPLVLIENVRTFFVTS